MQPSKNAKASPWGAAAAAAAVGKRGRLTRLKGTLMPFFLDVFSPPALSKEKLKGASTLASFGILINQILGFT